MRVRSEDARRRAAVAAAKDRLIEIMPLVRSTAVLRRDFSHVSFRVHDGVVIEWWPGPGKWLAGGEYYTGSPDDLMQFIRSA